MKERSESTANTSVASVFYSVQLSGSHDAQVSDMPDGTGICGSGRKQTETRSDEMDVEEGKGGAGVK